MWREGTKVWSLSQPGDSWSAEWTRRFGRGHKSPHDQEYDDGEGGRLRIGEHPIYPGYGIVFVRVYPPDREEIRIWIPPQTLASDK